MKSMTGFGRAQKELSNDLITLEISSVNKKNFEVVLSGPREWQSFEIPASKKINALIERGRIRISLSVESPPRDSPSLFDKSRMDQELDQFKDLVQSYGHDVDVNPQMILDLLKLRNGNENLVTNISEVIDSLYYLLDQSLKELMKMKALEGEILKKDMTNRVSHILKLTKQTEIESLNMTKEWKNKLLLRLKNSGLDLDVEDERVLKEVSLFSEKSDITEEITRIKSHIEQLQITFEQSGSIGRKIEFLLQELGREFNTICSKSCKIECTQLVLGARSELEKLREQVLNIE